VTKKGKRCKEKTKGRGSVTETKKSQGGERSGTQEREKVSSCLKKKNKEGWKKRGKKKHRLVRREKKNVTSGRGRVTIRNARKNGGELIWGIRENRGRV